MRLERGRRCGGGRGNDGAGLRVRVNIPVHVGAWAMAGGRHLQVGVSVRSRMRQRLWWRGLAPSCAFIYARVIANMQAVGVARAKRGQGEGGSLSPSLPLPLPSPLCVRVMCMHTCASLKACTYLVTGGCLLVLRVRACGRGKSRLLSQQNGW